MNENNELELILKKEWSFFRIFVLVFLVVGVGIGVFATLTFRTIRGKALVILPTPSPLIEIIPSPKTNLESPYVRLVTDKSSYGLNSSVPVDVYLNTQDKETVEVDLVIKYDADSLEIDPAKIELEDIYKTIKIDEKDNGILSFSLFIDPQIGHKPVVLSSEKKIATLNFKSGALTKDKVEIKLEFVKGKTTQTSLIEFKEVRPVKLENILNSVESISFSIES